LILRRKICPTQSAFEIAQDIVIMLVYFRITLNLEGLLSLSINPLGQINTHWIIELGVYLSPEDYRYVCMHLS
jgi:hypothetical protein